MAHGRRRIWVERVARWRESGLTAREFAAQIAVKQGTLTKWKYRLAHEQEQRPVRRGNSPVEVEFVEVASATPQVPTSSGDRERLEVVCAGGRIVRVPAAFEAESLLRLVDALERR